MSGSLLEVVPVDGAAKPEATVSLTMQQCRKIANIGECPPELQGQQSCPTQITQGTEKFGTCPVYLGFVLDAGLPLIVNGKQVTLMNIKHEPLLTSNDLNYTETDTTDYKTPKFVPVIGAQLRDTKQNCFFPSEFKPDRSGLDKCEDVNNPSCCNLSKQTDYLNTDCKQ